MGKGTDKNIKKIIRNEMKKYKIEPQIRISSLYNQGEDPSAKPQGDRRSSHSFSSIRTLSEPKAKNLLLIIVLLLLFLSGCGRKMDPTLEDYLQPEPAQNLTLSASYDKIVISWSYPEKNKSKLNSFLLEREKAGQIKSLGYFDNQTNSYEDKDFALGETYKYRLFAINKKGIYSKSIETSITPRKLPEVENIQYKITEEGVMLSWQAVDSVMYNIYLINQKGEKSKKGFTDKNFFHDKITSSTLSSFISSDENITNTAYLQSSVFSLQPSYLTYLISPYISEGTSYIEGTGRELKILLDDFIPSKPEEVFWAINENGVYISWKEVPEKWIKGYKIYRKTAIDSDFILIGETLIPLFFDVDYNINNLKTPIYYRIFSEGPLKNSETVEIKVEVQNE